MAPKPEPARLAFVFGKESRILQPVSPVLVAFSAILLTSVALLAVDSFIDTEALTFIYLLPTIAMAMHYGSTVGVLTSFASALAAGYFCFPPKFSFFISDPLNVGELGFFLLLALIASKAVAVVTKDDRVTRRTPALPFSRVPSPLSGQKHRWGRTRYVSEWSLPARSSNPAPKRPQRQRLRPTLRFWPSDSIGAAPQDLGRDERDWG